MAFKVEKFTLSESGNPKDMNCSSANTVARSKRSLGIILPTYCEVDNIESLIREIKSVRSDALIMVIDDSSPDGTAKVVEKLAGEYNKILLLKRPSKLGLGTAITDGFRAVLSLKDPPEHIITMDADYSHDPKSIPNLIATAERGYDLVIGSRYSQGGKIVGWHILRQIISRAANLIASAMVGMRIHDCTSGFRVYSKEYIENVIGCLHSQTYEIQIETVKQAWMRGFALDEVPIKFENRKKGKSKLTRAEFQGFLSYIVKTNLPFRNQP
ncbi:MAG: polyprenol monophosphomannose synthase [Candidatus Bathyarchaeota archaeon]|nr:MAG: polyprenol monophosphomannose synthase [Candidatus Bathyarchaeota archaeon]